MSGVSLGRTRHASPAYNRVYYNWRFRHAIVIQIRDTCVIWAVPQDAMARNVEVKARVESFEAVLARAAAIADQGPFQMHQDDTFFACANGRLKLREFSPDRGELIFYRRENKSGPKESFYVRTVTSEPAGLRECLTLAHGQAGRVQKHRTLFLAGRSRVHLDRVAQLGDFLEIEVVLHNGESIESGINEANDLMKRLGLSSSQLVEEAYVDLMTINDSDPLQHQLTYQV